ERARQDLGRHPLDENLALEVHRVVQLEKIVRVARVAVHASELAAAIRVDGPSKRHARAVASIENLPHRHLDKLDAASGVEVFGRRRIERQCGDGIHLTEWLSSLFLRYSSSRAVQALFRWARSRRHPGRCRSIWCGKAARF